MNKLVKLLSFWVFFIYLSCQSAAGLNNSSLILREQSDTSRDYFYRYLRMLGSNPDGPVTLSDQMIDEFVLNGGQKNGFTFKGESVDSMNGFYLAHIIKKDVSRLYDQFLSYDKAGNILDTKEFYSYCSNCDEWRYHSINGFNLDAKGRCIGLLHYIYDTLGQAEVVHYDDLDVMSIESYTLSPSGSFILSMNNK